MKSHTTSLIAALVLTGVTSLGFAAQVSGGEAQQQAGVAAKAPGLTRAQVRADFIAARDAGELIVGENGEKAKELNPQWYPAHAAKAPTLSRAEVKKEVIAAQRKGTLDTNDTLRDSYPARAGN